ncbi:hypothetical protein BU16DRAFT_529762 [Lophium mytilinum]|uniref:Uncharacterized protein n=1 Tax=Lophium mytilinum TaxID=390894 RepID=A0A6A6QJN1_9PEZI|nr:hypothetical protein BU16DRAFT_529762 [Lophium mytilinum]
MLRPRLFISPLLLLLSTHVSAQLDLQGGDPKDSDACLSLSSVNELGFLSNGVDIWKNLNIDSILTNFVSGGLSQTWVKDFYLNEALTSDEAANAGDFDCTNENSPCVPVFGSCDKYQSAQAMSITFALVNAHRLLSIQIKAYDEAVNIFSADGNSVANDLFNHVSMGRDLGKFDVGAFFSGFEFGVELALPALGGVFVDALKAGLKKGLKTVVENAVESNFNLGDNPAKDPGPFIDSLRTAFKSNQDALRAVMAGYFNQGNTDPTLTSTPEDTVAYLQQGQFLAGFLTNGATEASATTDAAHEIVKQAAAPIIAATWRAEGVKVILLPEAGCDPTNFAQGCQSGNGPCGPFDFVANQDQLGSVDGKNLCIGVGRGFDREADANPKLQSFFMNPQDVLLNAAKCLVSGKNNDVPPAQTEDMANGFPLCTFALKS